MPLSSRVIFQMDQATLTHKVIFRDDGKRGKDTNQDRSVSLRTGSHHQKMIKTTRQSVYNITDFKRDHFREYAIKSGTFG